MKTIEEKLIEITKINAQLDFAEKIIRVVQMGHEFELHVKDDIGLRDAISNFYIGKKIVLMAEASELMK